MTELELQLNARFQAEMMMMQRLLVEIARMKDDGPSWIDRFRNAVVTELADAKSMDGSERDKKLISLSQSVVTNLAKMAKHRFEEEQGRPLL